MPPPPTAVRPTMLRASPVPLHLTRDDVGSGRRLRDDPQLHRVRPHVYTERAAYRQLAPWDRYLTRVHAALLVFPDAVLSHESAAAVLGLPIFGEPRDIHLFSGRRARSKRFGDVLIHTSLSSRPIWEVGGVVVTSPLATVADLGRVLPPAFGLSVADAARRTFEVEPSDVRALVDGQHWRRGIRKLSWLLDRVRHESESVGETVSRAVIEWCGFEPPELQLVVRSEGYDDRVDFAWPSQGVLAESDGYGKYLLDTDGVLSALRREKAREDRLRRSCRAFARWDWAETMRVTPLAARLSAAGVVRRHPRNETMLATLGANTRSLRPVEKPSFA